MDDVALIWQLVAARVTSISILSLINILQRRRELISGKQLGILAATGILETGGGAFFPLATHVGRLDVSTILSSLYPVATVVFAWAILKERFKRQQWAGIFLHL